MTSANRFWHWRFCCSRLDWSLLGLRPVHAGEQPAGSGYKVLEPIRHGSLTVFPVVAPKSYADRRFLTLDEGLRSGEVVVTEYGNVRGLLRRQITRTGSCTTAPR